MTKKPNNGIKILEEAIIIFDKVNNKIDGLIECSVKDFEILNTNFKDLYFNLQQMAVSAEKVINHINFLDTNQKLKKLTNLKSYNKNQIVSSLNNNIIRLKKVDKSLSYYILFLSNIKQDLSTIRLLITNLRFDPTIQTDFNNLHILLNSISDWHKNQEDVIINLRTNLKSIIKFSEEGLFNSIEISGELIEKCIDTILYYLKLSKDSKKHAKYLEELESIKTSSTSEIITNLQFQDILRQQIEHIQKSHYEITNSLKNSHKENEPLSKEELYKIRDINTLQSAQLIHANREYQSAVEKILHKINDLSSLHNQYNTFWIQFCKPESIKLNAFQNTITEQLTILNSQMFSINHLSDKFNQMIKDTEDKYKLFLDTQTKSKSVNSILSDIKNNINKIEQNRLKENAVNPISQINNELNKIENTLHKINEDFHNTIQKDNKKLKSFLREKNINKDIIISFTNILEEFNNELQNNTETLTLKLQLEKMSSFNIEQVSYYKTFEKEVHEIIKLLDNLLSNINLSRKELNKEELEHVRKLYTMQSERNVHDEVTGNDKNKEKDKDKNDVEFF